METILSIDLHDQGNDEGYIIRTSKQTIKFLIDMDQDCCETPGYLITNDETKMFIDAEIIGFSTTDEKLVTKKAAEIDEIMTNLDEGNIIFFNIETSKGTLQFAAYNSHNGYYGHTCKIIKTQEEEFRL